MHYSIRNMMDLSTCHVPSENPDWKEVRVVTHDYGWIVFLGSSDDETQVPTWLIPIWKLAQDYDCLIINFDADAERFDIFETYSW